MFADRDSGRGAVRRELLERERERISIRAARRETIAGARRGDAQRYRRCRTAVRSWRVVQMPRHLARGVAKRLRAACRQQQRRIRGRMSRRQVEQPLNHLLFLEAREYGMRIGAAESERAHADDERDDRRPRAIGSMTGARFQPATSMLGFTVSK